MKTNWISAGIHFIFSAESYENMCGERRNLFAHSNALASISTENRMPGKESVIKSLPHHLRKNLSSRQRWNYLVTVLHDCGENSMPPDEVKRNLCAVGNWRRSSSSAASRSVSQGSTDSRWENVLRVVSSVVIKKLQTTSEFITFMGGKSSRDVMAGNKSSFLRCEDSSAGTITSDGRFDWWRLARFRKREKLRFSTWKGSLALISLINFLVEKRFMI